LTKKHFLFFFLCKNKKIKKIETRQRVSDESQFHHPPHEPSWKAHQDPNIRAKDDIKREVL
jgi:hypothetical protein